MKRNSLLVFLVVLFAALKCYAAGPIYKIQIKDYIIHPITGEYLSKAIARAQEEKAQALLIVLDTPGGLLQTTHNIVKEIMNADIPIIVYVAPAGARAASAGAFITLAAHIAAMAPSTHMGAAHPVQLGEEGDKETLEKIKEKLFKKEKKEEKEKPATTPMSEKIMQDTLAWVENIAKARNRNIGWAKKAVEKSVSSTAQEAKNQGVIDFIATDEQDLLRQLDGKEVKLPSRLVKLNTKDVNIGPIELNWRQAILNVLINPNIAYILMTLGFYGLLFEITHPGSWGPGVAGLISILLAFYSFHVVPPNYAGIILTVVGFLLLAAEVFVASHGLAAFGGLVCLVFGALFLVDTPAAFLKVSLKVVIPTILASTAIIGALTTLILKTHRHKISTGPEGLIGEIGEVDIDLNPTGKVYIAGELWNAQSSEPIPKGEKVQILKVENLKLYVKKV